MKIIKVSEGETSIEVPDPSYFRTAAGDYSPSLTHVFYNPTMEFCRDISVSAAQVFAKKIGDLRAFDPLAGVGVRGIRYAKEVEGVSKVIANDRSTEAYEFIKSNVETNNVGEIVEAKNSDANIVLLENRGKFNLIDIDPFGSPAPFLETSCSAISKFGMLAITATDTAPLSGTHARACMRRYGAKPLRTEYAHEIGIRILIGFAQRIGGIHEVALTPVLSHSTKHYFRVYLLANRGAQRTNDVLREHGFVSHCKVCMRRFLTRGLAPELTVACECGGRFSHAGPLWLGKLIDITFAKEVFEDLAMRNFKLKHQELMLLDRCIEEAEGPPTFYELNELARRARCSPPKIDKLLARIRNKSYFASRTHFSNTSFRTDAPMEEIVGSLKGV